MHKCPGCGEFAVNIEDTCEECGWSLYEEEEEDDDDENRDFA